jgi:hypothetical protein
MHLTSQTFKVPKAGLSLDYYEDAFAPTKPIDAEESTFRFALADGATESARSGPWAKQLVRALHKSGPDFDRLCQDLPKLQATWRAAATRSPLPWYAEERVRRGAFAAVLGLELTDERRTKRSSGRWSALAIGDTCLFHVRGADLVHWFPIGESALFSNSPTLLSSDPAANSAVLDKIQFSRGRWFARDRFYLMTDAVACWFLSSVEANAVPWPLLNSFGTPVEEIPYPSFIGVLRERREIRNDDSTFTRVEIRD